MPNPVLIINMFKMDSDLIPGFDAGGLSSTPSVGTVKFLSVNIHYATIHFYTSIACFTSSVRHQSYTFITQHSFDLYEGAAL